MGLGKLRWTYCWRPDRPENKLEMGFLYHVPLLLHGDCYGSIAAQV